MATCETVKIVADGGYAIINKADFDKGKHKLYSEKKAAPKAEPQAVPAKPKSAK